MQGSLRDVALGRSSRATSLCRSGHVALGDGDASNLAVSLQAASLRVMETRATSLCRSGQVALKGCHSDFTVSLRLETLICLEKYFGRELVIKCLIKSTENGRPTFVWTEKWIMDDTPRRPVNKQHSCDINLKDGLHDVGDTSDREIWAFTTNCAFLVKSDYCLATKVARMSSQVVSAQDEAGLDLKRKIWKI
ncbi:hypothetical protein F2Q70_00003444 [Brassica cretica]|uniref:Uncharacterized protein n=1 Tax=Brassica cretica TaxID=69181 RepID=A0A8S9IQM9_BRACR|nr:hypothetical protein F2Q70_00003444 [Brassica cretica]